MSYDTLANATQEQIDNATVVTLPLFEDTYYTYSIPLEGKTYTFEFLWLSRQEQWVWSIFDEDDVELQIQKVLVNEYWINPPVNSGLTGAFYLAPIMSNSRGLYNTYKDSLSDYYTLLYVYLTT